MVIVEGSEYTKGGITFARTTSGKLVRVNKPTNQVGIAVATPGKKRTGKAAQKLTSEQLESSKPKTIAISVGKEEGKTVVKNIEPYVGKSGVKQISRLTDVYGHLTTTDFKTESTPTEIKRSVNVYATTAPAPEVAVNKPTTKPITPPSSNINIDEPVFAPARSYAPQETMSITPEIDIKSLGFYDQTPELTIEPTSISKQLLAKEAGRKALSQEGKLTTREFVRLPRAVFIAGKEFVGGALSVFNPFNLSDVFGKVVESGARIGTKESTFGKELKPLVTSFDTSLRTDTFRTLGAATSKFIVPSAIKGVKKAYVKVGSEKIPTATVFSEQVISGKTSLPKTGSTAETLKLFEATRKDGSVFAQTSAPQKLSGKTAGVGKKASTGFEDPGIYVTPRGEGSPYFLGIKKGGAGYSFSANPLAPFKGLFKLPTVTEFKATAAKLLPKKVTDVPGFKAVKKFQESRAGKGEIYVTKRSQLGQGELKPKINPETGKLEVGTSELEAVVPVGQRFGYTPSSKTGFKGFISRIKGFEKYTEFEGELVPIRTTELLIGERGVVKPTTIIKGEKILSESQYSKTYTGEKIVSPSFSVPKSTTSSLPTTSSLKISSNEILSGSTISSINRDFKPPKSTVPSIKPSKYKLLSSLSTSTVISQPSKKSSTSRRNNTIRSSNLSLPKQSVISSSLSKRTIKKPFSSISTVSSKPSPITSSYYRPSLTTDYTSTKPSFSRIKFNQPKRSSGFFVEIRERGLFRRTTGRYSDVKTAFLGGRQTVGQKAAASFRIREERTGRIVSDLNVQDKTIRKSKKELGVFIERLGKRIKSGGELKEITYKGITAQRRKL